MDSSRPAIPVAVGTEPPSGTRGRPLAGAVLGRRDDPSRRQVVPVILAIVGVGREHMIGIESRRAVGTVGAGPLNARACRQLFVAEPTIVTRAAARAFLPGFEALLRRLPFDQRRAVPVAEVHAMRVVEKNIEIGTC